MIAIYYKDGEMPAGSKGKVIERLPANSFAPESVLIHWDAETVNRTSVTGGYYPLDDVTLWEYDPTDYRPFCPHCH